MDLGTNVGVQRQYDLLPDHFGHHTSVRNAVMFCGVTVAAVAATMSASAAAGYSKHRAPKAQELQRERAPKVRAEITEGTRLAEGASAEGASRERRRHESCRGSERRRCEQRAPKAQELQRERAPKVRQRAPKARELQRD